MSWSDAVEIVAAWPAYERFRTLCADTWPDHAAYRELAVKLATGEPLDAQPAAATTDDNALRGFVAQHGCGGCG